MPRRSRHSGGEKSQILRVAGLTLDVGNRQVSGCGETYKLTPKECRLLEAFMRYPGKVLSHKFLMKEVWETNYLDDTRTLDVHICWLRKKIEKITGDYWSLKTVRGVGYRFDLAEE